MTHPTSPLRRAVHSVCMANRASGWRLCLTAWRDGLAVHAQVGNRIRAVVAEASGSGDPATVLEQLRAGSIKLAVEELSAKQSVELIEQIMSRHRAASGDPRPSLTLVDLYESGYVEVASLNAPPVIVLDRASRVTREVRPTEAGQQNGLLACDDLDAVVVLSPTAARALGEDPLRAAVGLVRRSAHPCQLRDQLLGGAVKAAETTSPMAVLLRMPHDARRAD
jgi:hypothetical protein